MDTSLRHRVNAGREIVLHQTAFFRRQFGDVTSEWKLDDSRVTFADFAISEKIFAELRKIFPTDHLCSEEANPLEDSTVFESRYVWILDPIDGTNNYALGLAHCAISLALLRDGEPVYGFVYDLSRDLLIHGGPGAGLFAGARSIKPRHAELTEREGVIGMQFPMTTTSLQALQPLLSTYRVRSLGSTALSLTYTAEGIFAGCIHYKVKIWDIAAAVALLRGAGLEIHYMALNPFPLKQFHINDPIVPFYAGNPAFCKLVHGLKAGIGH
jgi:myo-inositol-1(or 4)-monophosphatase